MVGILEEYKNSALLTTRLVQLVSIALTLTGFVWATSDLLVTYVLSEGPVTPLSVLFMVYGLMGSIGSELIARRLSKAGPEKKE